ncbi:hypothetical protein LVO39_001956 [Salmonella enterica]|uniref:Fimbrial protein n=5 Tax=Salmonella enterica I TaxID=59201 RepID=A0A7Z1Q9N2_SALET|nr:hypothetical protein [Salmonella enterica]EAA4615220.1 hypothetical protein [Salmonella enterica subsp. enterica serovar Muenchen]EBK1959200.1 hypothetical protein [Salmonella enterica subsp. enterica serovar Newport]EBR7997116.1 hypothetical protein [Salmonella enterica subsp. enterica serovar Panama]EBW8393709.1 hypothetical protein [Salmonella enterica subsp. enterica serovar Florida]ECA3794911.1 hypothetical protein [Salmonella enterica subsp. enterica serovar Aqua]ECC3882166.1 hypothe
MKNVKIMAVAAALSAVMTGSVFAATAVGGQELTISTTFNSGAVSYAEVQSEHVSIVSGKSLAADTLLAKITNLPVGAKLIDTTAGNNSGQILFTKVGDNSVTFPATVKDASDNVLSDNTAGTTASVYDGAAVVSVKTAAVINNAQPGVYTSQPTVYTYTD